MSRDAYGMPLPEITVWEKLSLGRLVAAYQRGDDWVAAKTGPELDVFRELAERQLAERHPQLEQFFKMTGAGLRAFHQGRVVHLVPRRHGAGQRVVEIEPAKE